MWRLTLGRLCLRSMMKSWPFGLRAIAASMAASSRSLLAEARNGVRNLRGTVAMARTNDPNSATAQFFINVVNNNRLDKSGRSAGYAVFGKVTEGMDVVDKIRRVKTTSVGDNDDVPVEDVLIKSIRRGK